MRIQHDGGSRVPTYVYLARFIGLFTVLLVVGLLVRGSAMVEAAVADAPVMLVYALVSLAAGLAISLEIVPLEIRRAEDIGPAFEGLASQADAIYVLADPIFTVNRNQIITLALGARLPATFNARAYVQGGGLMSYGPDFSDLFRRSAELVDKILHGAKPGDIPVEQPTKFELAINLKTAKALGLTVPPSLLVTADEVIE